jgi:hypothetical protein
MSPEQNEAMKLEKWLIERCRQQGTNRIPTRDVLNRGPYSLRQKPDFDSAITVLAGSNRVRIVDEGKQRFVEVNPALLSQGGTDDPA